MSDITHILHMNNDKQYEQEHKTTTSNMKNVKLSDKVNVINEHIQIVDQTLIDFRDQLNSAIDNVNQAFYKSLDDAFQLDSDLQNEIERYVRQIASLQYDRSEAERELNAVKLSLSSAQTNQADLNARLSRDLDALAAHSSKAARRAITARKKKPVMYEFVNVATNTIKLPGSIIDSIFTFLPAADLACCARSCRHWHQAIDRTNVWRMLLKRLIEHHHRRRHARSHGEQVDMMNDDFDPDVDPLIRSSTQLDEDVLHDTPSPRSPTSPLINLPYPDANTVHHMHYCLTITHEPTGTYSINVTSRLVKTLYQCAAWSESFDGIKPGVPKKGDKITMNVMCMLMPKADSGDLDFCKSVSEIELQKSVALADIARLTKQCERDEAIKAGFDLEIDDCNREAALIDGEVDTRTAQHMADELTMSFLQENCDTLVEQLAEEKKQTESLRAILSAHRAKQEAELSSREAEQERLEASFSKLNQQRKHLLREGDLMKSELDAEQSQAEMSLTKMKEIRHLVTQLSSQLRSA